MAAKPPKRPRDPFQLAEQLGDMATGQVTDVDPASSKNPAPVERGRKGGFKGGQSHERPH
jgi:hypothetical protein